MRTDQEKQLKAMMNNALELVKNANAFISSMELNTDSIKGLSPDQLKDLQKQTDLIKENTKIAESELDKLTKK